MTSSSRVAALAAVTAALGATAAFAVTAHRAAPAVAPPAQARAAGALVLSDSRGGQAIFSASNLAPGGSATGTVTITNTGAVPGSLTLAPGSTQTSGPRGQALLGALRLRIADVSEGALTSLYDGGLGELPTLALTTLDPGAARTFRFSASLPDRGPAPDDAGDNLLQRASMSVGYVWTLTQSSEPPVIEPPGVQPPGVTPPTGAPLGPGARPPAGAPATSARRRCPRHITGNARGNRLTGTSGGDRIYGRGGADRIRGRGGIDCLWGGAGKDRIDGGPGADQIHGGTGSDVITGNAGSDRITAGFGSDLVYARDGRRDWIDCGPGRDRAVVDRNDRVRHCELVFRMSRHASRAG